MRSMQIIEWGKPLELRCYETPEPQGREVLVRVDACGVCHSDLHIWDGYFDLGNGQKFPISERGVHPPFTLGHEPVGTVISKGPDAGPADTGRSYAIYPWIECGKCQPCRNGLTQICDMPSIIGTRVDGAYSDHVIVPDAKYLVDHTGIAPELACTLACSGLTGFSALKKLSPAGLGQDDTLLIVGSGGLGLMAISLARAITKARIVAADIDSAKRQAAIGQGADLALDSGDPDAGAQLQEFASGNGRNGLAACIDFVGLPQTMAFGLAALRKGGSHIHVGLFGGAHNISLPPTAFRMLNIRGSYVGTLEEFKELVLLVQNGLEIPVPISTRPLEEASLALSELQQGNVVGRTVLLP